MPPTETTKESARFSVQSLFVLAVLVSLPSLLWHNWPSPDAAMYYLPMIREFKQGNWEGAWFHMIPPLFTVMAGVVSMVLALPVLFAGKLVSILFFAGSVFPLYRILKPIYGRRQAEIGCLLMVFCSRLIRDGAAPLLDSTKMFIFLWCVCLTLEAFRRLPAIKNVLLMAGAVAALALIRGEGLALAVIFIAAWGAAEIISLGKRAGKIVDKANFPWRTFAVAALFLALISPWAAYLYKQTGYPVLDSRQIYWLERSGMNNLMPFNNTKDTLSSNQREIQTLLSGRVLTNNNLHQELDDDINNKKHTTFQLMRAELFPEIFKGVYRYYLPLYIVGIIFHVRRKKWSRLDWALGGLFLAHSLLMIIAVGGLWTQARYLLPAAPLLFGWAAIGGIEIINWMGRKMPGKTGRKVIYTTLITLAAIMVFNGNLNAFHYLRLTRITGKYTPVITAAEWIRDHGSEVVRTPRPPLRSTEKHYHSGRRPVLLCVNRQLPFLAASDAVFLDIYSCDLDPAAIVELAQLKTVDFIVVDNSWNDACKADSDMLAGLPEVDKLAEFGDEKTDKVRILHVKPR